MTIANTKNKTKQIQTNSIAPENISSLPNPNKANATTAENGIKRFKKSIIYYFLLFFLFLFGKIKSFSTAYIPAAMPNKDKITVNQGLV